jgi:protein involved in polysaccharide export with SLBB domain
LLDFEIILTLLNCGEWRVTMKLKKTQIAFIIYCLSVFTCPLIAYSQFQSDNFAGQRDFDSLGRSSANQKFDFSSPQSDLEKTQGQVGTFPKIILDKPVNPDEYIIGVGDTLLLISFGKIKVNIPLTVGPEGKVLIPDYGDLLVSRFTLSQVKDKIFSIMKRKYSGLQFTLLLADPRAFKIFVLGEVNNPGIYVTTALERVSDAIARAGGIKNSGSVRRVQVKRDGKVAYADLWLFQQTGDLVNNPNLLESDIIYVSLSLPKVTLGGAVRRSGVYELETKEDLLRLINRTGGLASKVSYEKPIKILRQTKRDEKEVIKLNLIELTDPKSKPLLLQDGDTVFVPSTDDVPVNETNIYITGEVRKPGSFPYVPGYTVKTYMGMAGGLTQRARFTQAEIIKADGRKMPLKDDTVLEVGDTINVPERFIKVWQDCLVITTSISSLALAVIAAFK